MMGKKYNILIVDDIQSHLSKIKKVIEQNIGQFIGEVGTERFATKVAKDIKEQEADYKYQVIIADVFMLKKEGDIPSEEWGAFYIYKTIKAINEKNSKKLNIKLIIISSKPQDIQIKLPAEYRASKIIYEDDWVFRLPKYKDLNLEVPNLLDKELWLNIIYEAIRKCEHDDWMSSFIQSKDIILDGTSPKSLQTLQSIAELKDRRIILIIGEPGTGADAVAYKIHHDLRREEKDFCRLLFDEIKNARELIEKLCGKVIPGQSSSNGLFHATNSTVFIENLKADEFAEDEMVEFLELIKGVSEDGNFSRIGSTEKINFNGSLVIGVVSKDKLWKLSDSFPIITTYPLRDRLDDIFIFAKNYFAKNSNEGFTFDEESKTLLKKQDWTANFDRLKNILNKITGRPRQLTSNDFHFLKQPVLLLTKTKNDQRIVKYNGNQLDRLSGDSELAMVFQAVVLAIKEINCQRISICNLESIAKFISIKTTREAFLDPQRAAPHFTRVRADIKSKILDMHYPNLADTLWEIPVCTGVNRHLFFKLCGSDEIDVEPPVSHWIIDDNENGEQS